MYAENPHREELLILLEHYQDCCGTEAAKLQRLDEQPRPFAKETHELYCIVRDKYNTSRRICYKI